MADPEALGRDETPEERLDRKWVEILQELRVMQTGAQLVAGILLTLPFQDPFAELDTGQRTLYLTLVVLAILTTAFVLSPVAVHRRIAGRHIKQRLVRSAHLMMQAALTSLSLLLVGMTGFVFDVVVDRAAAVAAAASMGLIVVLLLIALPHRLVSGSAG